jgi:hypothetical protein
LLRHNTYGVIGDGRGVGHDSIDAYFPRAEFDRNVLAGGQPSLYPAGNYFPSLFDFESAFVNAAAGDFSLVAATPFRAWASDGGPLGANIARVLGAIAGLAVPTPEGPSPGYDVPSLGPQ